MLKTGPYLIATLLVKNEEDILEHSLKHHIEEQNIQFISLKEQFDYSTPTGKLYLVIISALVEFEKELMLEIIFLHSSSAPSIVFVLELKFSLLFSYFKSFNNTAIVVSGLPKR